MGKPLRVLVIEDSEDDTLLVIRALQKGGYDPIYERVETAETMRSAVREKQWDIIICDYKMPKFTAPSAIAVLKETNIDIPLLIVSGAIGEETAVKCIRLGARDYIMKNNLSRLCPTINRELEETKGRNKQKRSEEALRESEKRYRELTDFLPISTFEVDAAGNIITFNRAALEVFRYNQEDYKEGMTALQFFAPEEWQRVGANLGQVIQGTSIPGQEYTFLRKDGSTFVGLIYASPSIHENKTVGIRGAIIDITQRKLAEEELIWKTAFLEAQVEASIDGILVVDDKGKVIQVNTNFLNLMKVPQHIRDDTDDKPMLQHVTSLVKHPEQFLEKVIYLFEHPREISRDEIEFKDRMVLDRYSSPVIGKDGKYYGRIWTFRNITERKRSEEALRENEKRYRYLVQHAPTGIYEVDFTTRKFLSVNDVMCQYTGYTSEEFLQLDPMQLLTEESLKLFIQRHAKVLAGEVVPDNIEFKIKHKNGSEFWALLNVRYYYKPNNQILATVIAHDITERKLAEEALRIQNRTFSEVLNGLDSLVYVTDMKTYEIVFINTYGQNIWGDIKGKICWQTIQKGQPSPCEFCTNSQLIGPDGNPTKGVVWEFQNTVTKRWYDCRDKAIYWPDGRIVRMEIATDITERKQAEEALLASEEKYRTIIENMGEGYYEVDIKGNFTFFNESMREFLGYEREELSGMNNRQYLDEENTRKVYQVYNRAYRTGEPVKNLEWQVTRKDGDLRDIEVSISLIRNGEGHPTGFRGIARDNTERKQAEKDLRDKDKLLANVVNSTPDYIFVKDTELRNILCNEAYAAAIGKKPDELMGYTDIESGWDPELVKGNPAKGIRGFENDDRDALSGKTVHNFHDPANMGSEIRIFDTYKLPLYDEDNKIIGLLGIARDITEGRRAEEALRRSEMKFHTLYDSTSDAVMLLDEKGFFDCNKATLPMFGCATLEEFCSKHHADLSPPKQPCGADSKTLANERIAIAMEKGSINFEWIYKRNGTGETFPADVLLTAMELDGKAAVEAVVRDITDRKQAEESLRHAEERYRSIFEDAQEGIFRSTPDGKIIMANQAMAKMYGYESPEEMMASVTDVAHQHYVYPGDRRKLKEMIEEHGFIKGHEAQNCRKDGSIIWISRTMHAVHDEKGQITYYDGIIEDITNRKHAVERIKKALAATVQAIAVIVETRDPYTAGHQRRVADLARAIATEMNLPTDKIDGIRTAAVIHDLGKISVPAEILTKPTKLTDLEFGIIKTHAQSGYDILKDIEFPWPISRMVLEHHERMNGSGYPNGLLAEETLMESRILAVADVVEAMASHRPYRPSLGIDAALKEIEKNKGTLYDTSVVDACLRLFRENGCQLEQM